MDIFDILWSLEKFRNFMKTKILLIYDQSESNLKKKKNCSKYNLNSFYGIQYKLF